MNIIGTFPIFLVSVAILLFIRYQIIEKRKYTIHLTVLKDVGGQTIKEIRFKAKEELLPLDPSDLSNRGWFLQTKKKGGKSYIFPRPPYSHWIADNHCMIYSKSYKGNNYACLIDDTTFIENIQRFIKSKSTGRIEEGKIQYAIEDPHQKLHLAHWIAVESNEEKSLTLIDTATESIPVIFPKEAHEIRPIFDERHLPEMVALHTTMNQLFDFKGWWDKHGAAATAVGLLVVVIMAGMFNYKLFEEATKGSIKHHLTVEVEGQPVVHETIEPPPPPEQPAATPPPGGKFADILREQRDN